MVQIDTTASPVKEKRWLSSFDIDGDNTKDNIYFDFSGGGHCCYTITIYLSSDKKEWKFPFEMDGGYLTGVDNSRPEQFDIRDVDKDGLPEILMQIQSYNGSLEEVPREWAKKYGVKTNYIVLEFVEGQIKARDYKQQ